jgi:flagellar biosynthesis/type III secretory pathway protein FliH
MSLHHARSQLRPTLPRFSVEAMLLALALALMLAAIVGMAAWTLRGTGHSQAELVNARAVAYDQGFEAGRAEGRADGLADGKRRGSASGFEKGRKAGYARGLQKGRKAGYAKGVTDGYEQGYAAAQAAAAASEPSKKKND